MNMIAALYLWLALSKTPTSTHGTLRNALPPLSSLDSRCHLAVAPLSLFRDMLMVECGGRPIRVTEPKSLTSNVRIDSSEKALEFVRFFTSKNTFAFVDLSGFVEIIRKSNGESRQFIELATNPDWFHQPVVAKFRGELGGSEFQIDRFVVALDGGIYRIRELVTSEGDYRIVRQERIGAASEYGIVHLGKI